ncbi:MAG TPA: aminotransferase class V-fold PLP-dependent enzyme [Planctomycetota bacterium]|nr:aminotransferase class V-fold PLP-dependent enzyme [Planctomycetota bacterium]
MGQDTPVYLDCHATTPCDPRVVEAMLPAFSLEFGNPASRQHGFGRRAREQVELARQEVAALICCEPCEITFTSGATESINLAIKGAAAAQSSRGRHIVTCVTEHKAVLDSCQRLERSGFRVTYLPVESDGRVSVERLDRAIESDTILVTIMYANNEIGVIHPVQEIGALCRRRRILFHSDAVQALPHLPCDVNELGIDLLSLSAHKMYGPKGAGALHTRRRRPRVRLEPLIDGGGHERGLRSGTLNVPGIIGLGKACTIVAAERAENRARVKALRDHLLARLLEALPDTVINGSLEARLPNNLNVSFPGLRADTLLEALPDIALSSGSACSSSSHDGSYVLRGLGRSEDLAAASIRFGLGRFTTLEEVDRAARDVIAAVCRLRESSAEAQQAGCRLSSGEDCVAPSRPGTRALKPE